MPQENEKTSIVNGGVDVAALKKDQQPAPREIFGGEDLLEGKLDAPNHRRQDLNGMPEVNGDEAEASDEEVTLDLGEPSPEVMDYARRELGETDEVKCQTIQELRDMIYGNWGISWLLVALRGASLSGLLFDREGRVPAAQDGRRFPRQVPQGEEL